MYYHLSIPELLMDLGIFKNSTNYTVTQLFFAQRLVELVHRQTIDSYRLRVMNPYLILLELQEVYAGFMQGSVKNFETLESCIQEVSMLLERDEVLIYTEISKKYFINDLLKSIGKDHAVKRHTDISNALKLIIKANKNYTQNLLNAIDNYLTKPIPTNSDIYPILEKIDHLTSNLTTELIRLGYSKSYLYRYFVKAFVFDDPQNFDDSFECIRRLVDSKERGYKVWFKIISPGIKRADLSSFSDWELVETPDNQIKIELPNDIQKFITPKGHHFIGIGIDALDHYTALTKAKRRLYENFDILKLAYHSDEIRMIALAWVIDLSNPADSRLQIIKHIPDGKYPKGKEVLFHLQAKIPGILGNPNITSETKEKIRSAIRYLRYGNEAFEIEHQFINYWIGLEYLFSNDRDSTFTRIKENLPALQALLYIRRNVADFFKMTKQPEKLFQWQNFNPDVLDCLLRKETFEEIKRQTLIEFPLLAYRSWKFETKLFDDKERYKYLDQHQATLVQHLVRIYRFRNEIVHEARHGSDNQILSSNLKYYLTL
jgi:hypothetical protein